MKSKIALLFALLLWCDLKSKAQEYKASGASQNDFANAKTANTDTIRDEFNVKKKKTGNLIAGKSPGTMLTYYQLYLEEKDQSRADTLLYDLLKKDSAIDYKDKISLVSYAYTSDTKTQMLFLSDPNRLKEYRTYFLNYNITDLKSAKCKWAHYYNIVTLDSAYYQIAPDSLVKIQMAHHYNSLAWYSILTQKLNNVEYYLNQSIKYDPGSRYPYSNLPLLFLLKKHYKQAKALYLKYKDQPFDKTYPTYKDEFLEDFRELAREGVMNDDIKKITRLLKK